MGRGDRSIHEYVDTIWFMCGMYMQTVCRVGGRGSLAFGILNHCIDLLVGWKWDGMGCAASHSCNMHPELHERRCHLSDLPNDAVHVYA